jgi:two-component system, OmpR family, sensor histidine kinase ChvG
MPISRKSKPSMASGIDTATVKSAAAASSPSTAFADNSARPRPPARPAGNPGREISLQPGTGRRRWPVSPLTRRILAVNVLALALLAGGFLYLGKYQASLIGQQIESLKTQGEVFAAALGEGAVLDSVDEGEILLPDLARQMMRRLVEPTRTRARLFDVKGDIIADSRVLRGPGDAVQVHELEQPEREGAILRVANQIYDWILNLLPRHTSYPIYRESTSPRAEEYPEVVRALRGEAGSAIRSDPATGGLVFSVAIPIQRYKQVLGVVMLSTGSGEIEEELRTVRLELLRIFGVALLVTVLLSFYLAGTIARPIRRLAAAAERARGRRGRVEIPDFTQRGDEIGDLSRSLREMTEALWQRISAIESFAADVAHEIKNPLSSLRSAVETAVRIEDPANQRRLMEIILNDVERLDRLITDISDASRLDAELGRVDLEPVDIAAMLAALADVHEATRMEGSPRLVLTISKTDRELIVPGIETRLSQVFRNVIGNAVSFSPPSGEIRLTARHDGRAVLVTVEDEGPGIPEEKLTAIFDRFYTERPLGEQFGTHSGLGLSISKQIVEAHRGMIWAENRKDAGGNTIGARFSVRLPAVP